MIIANNLSSAAFSEPLSETMYYLKQKIIIFMFAFPLLLLYTHYTHHISNVIVSPVSGVEDAKCIARRKGNTASHLQG